MKTLAVTELQFENLKDEVFSSLYKYRCGSTNYLDVARRNVEKAADELAEAKECLNGVEAEEKELAEVIKKNDWMLEYERHQNELNNL